MDAPLPNGDIVSKEYVIEYAGAITLRTIRNIEKESFSAKEMESVGKIIDHIGSIISTDSYKESLLVRDMMKIGYLLSRVKVVNND